MEVMNKIIAELKVKSKTQKQLTDFLKIGKSQFSMWKFGKSTSYLKYISQIAEFLNVSTDYLLGNETKEKAPLPQLSENGAKALALFEKLPDKDKEFFIAMMRERLK